MSKITLLDETLREGEQAPGVTFNSKQKRRVAYALSELGVDMICLMPAVSPEDQEFTLQLAKEQDDLYADVCIASRLLKSEVDFAIEAEVVNMTPFSPVSDVMLEAMRKITREENLDEALKVAEYARDHGIKVHFAGVDASRADTDYLVRFVKEISSSIDNFILCDSVSLYKPTDVSALVSELQQYVSSIGVHMHNDFGLGVANTLAGIEAGADLISTTFNGIGPRAGNAPFEEVLLALKWLYGNEIETVNYESIYKVCQIVERESGITLQPNKPFVGREVYTHESGLHVHALTKNSDTFEPFSPTEIGREREIVYGKTSGRSSIKYACGHISEDLTAKILEKVKELSKKKGRSLVNAEVAEIYSGILNEN